MRSTKEDMKALKIFPNDGRACLYQKHGNCSRVRKREVGNTVTMLPFLLSLKHKFLTRKVICALIFYQIKSITDIYK